MHTAAHAGSDGQPTDAARPDVVIYPSKGKLVLSLLGALAFVAVGVWMIIHGWANQGESFLILAGLLVLAFFGFCAGYALLRLLVPKPSLVIGPHGLLDNASAMGAGFITWDEVAWIKPYQFQGQTFLGIVPRDLQAVLKRQSAMTRKAMEMNVSMNAAPINIPQSILPMRVEALAQLIAERYRVHVAREA